MRTPEKPNAESSVATEPEAEKVERIESRRPIRRKIPMCHDILDALIDNRGSNTLLKKKVTAMEQV